MTVRVAGAFLSCRLFFVLAFVLLCPNVSNGFVIPPTPALLVRGSGINVDVLSSNKSALRATNDSRLRTKKSKSTRLRKNKKKNARLITEKSASFPLFLTAKSAAAGSEAFRDTTATVAEQAGAISGDVFRDPSTVIDSSNTPLSIDSLLPPPQQLQQERRFPMLDNIMSNLNMGNNPSLLQGRLLVIAASAIYGTNFATVKLMNSELPTAAAAALRFSLAAAVVVGLLMYQEQNTAKATTTTQVKERGPAMWRGAEVGMWYCVGYLSQAWALHTVDASKSAFFNTLAVLVVPLLDAAFKNKKLGWNGIASVATALAGVALVQLGPSLQDTATSLAATMSHSQQQHHLATALTTAINQNPQDNHHLLSLLSAGDLFCLAQALFFGIGYWRLESASVQYPNQAERITAGQLVAVALGSLAFFLVHDGVPSLALVESWLHNPFILKAALWTGLVSTALAIYMETVALKVVSAAELTVLMTSVSVFGSAFAYVALGEVVPPMGMVGGALILAGCALTAIPTTASTPESNTADIEKR